MKTKILLIAASCLIVCRSGGATQEDISKIDKNFAEIKVENRPVCYYDALNDPRFAITGFPWRKPRGPLVRIPDRLLTGNQVNTGVQRLGRYSSGGMIRFQTDSKYIALKAAVRGSDANHMPRNNSVGFDIYELVNGKWMFRRVVGPSGAALKAGGFETLLLQWGRGMREFLINLPLYGSVSSLQIGIAPGAKLEKPAVPWKTDNRLSSTAVPLRRADARRTPATTTPRFFPANFLSRRSTSGSPVQPRANRPWPRPSPNLT